MLQGLKIPPQFLKKSTICEGTISYESFNFKDTITSMCEFSVISGIKHTSFHSAFAYETHVHQDLCSLST